MGIITETDLKQSMEEEADAVKAYKKRAWLARSRGDEVSARLWEHIAEEENGHYNEFKDRLAVLGQSEHEPLYVGYVGMETTGYPPGPAVHKRSFPQTYGDWVDLAESIKTRYTDDPVGRAVVNYSLGIIAREGETMPVLEEGEVDDAKRWLTEEAGRLGIG